MAYRIEPGEPIAEAIRRIGREEIDGALADLSHPHADAAVHSLRKRFKRLRALLRLVSEDGAHEHDVVLRDAGRLLAESRDRRVAADTSRRLADLLGHEALGRLADRLGSLRQDAPEPDLPALRATLEAMRAETDGWQAPAEVASLLPSLRRTYKQGRRRHAIAHAEPTAEHLHEWRKRVKDLWYQVTLLAAIAPAIAPLVDDLDALGDTLGLDHDHAVVEALAVQYCPEADLPATRVALADERARLQDDAWVLGARIYAADPDEFLARLT